MSKLQVIDDLIKVLNDATAAYDIGQPVMSDEKWDKLYFELLRLEQQNHYYPPNSPTEKVIYEVQTVLNKVKHSHLMLSLNKTKSLKELNTFISNFDMDCICMPKMDGLTCSLTYENGELIKAETRGNGEIGEDITANAKTVSNIPKRIEYKGKLIVDGEMICKTDEFFSFGFNKNYKNPRNFAAGSIRLLNNAETAQRHLSFIVWDVIEAEKSSFETLSDKLQIASEYFEVVPFEIYNKDKMLNDDMISTWQERCKWSYHYPIDGLVFKVNDIKAYIDGGLTAHHPKSALAFKFYDESAETVLKDIEWGMGRSGQLTPVAIFEPVELDGTTVERASLYNISVLRETLGKPWVGRIVSVFKSNAIIPQLETDKIEEVPDGKKEIDIPKCCPYCGKEVIRRADISSIGLYCTNSACPAKFINIINHFCGKKGLDIKGLSKVTLEKLLDYGWINEYADIFLLKEHKDEWAEKAGFGAISVQKILDSIEKARTTTISAFISAIGIPQIGANVAKDICQKVGIRDYKQFRQMVDNMFDFTSIGGIGMILDAEIRNFDYTNADKVAQYLTFESEDVPVITNNTLKDITFVITGSLKEHKNRAELAYKIEGRGGKVASSVSKKVDYLICNDKESNSAKAVAARKINISIISEKDLKDIFKI